MASSSPANSNDEQLVSLLPGRLNPAGQDVVARRFAAPLLLLLVMKVANNMLGYEMTSVRVLKFHQNQTQLQLDYSATLVYSIIISICSFLLPTLAGVLSDVKLGIVRTLWLCVVMQLCCSIVLAALDSLRIISLFSTENDGIPVFVELCDTMFLYTIMLFSTGRNSRLLVISLYFMAYGVCRGLGYLPNALRLRTNHLSLFIGVTISVCQLVCMILLNENRAAKEVFRARSSAILVVNIRMLKKFYIIAAGCIPFFLSAQMCEIDLYPSVFSSFTNSTGANYFADLYTGFSTFQVAIVALSITIATVAYRNRVPEWFTIERRINMGVCIMIITKVPLLILLILGLVFYLSGASFTAVWAICAVFSMCDGVGSALALVAWCELMCCIADKRCKATMIGVFYTVWGFVLILRGYVVPTTMSFILKGHVFSPCVYTAFITILLIISLVYWRTFSWPRARGLLAEYEEEFLPLVQ